MTLEQLRIFVAVAERLHMTRAAEHLHLTQSAVSAAISALESRYGQKLFDRVGRGLDLNSAGQAFLPEARAVLAQAEAARSMLDDLAGLKRGSVSIYASQTIGAYWLPQRMARFHRGYPDVQLHLHIGNTHQVIEAVSDGRAEIGLVEGEEEAPQLERQAIGADRLILAASPHHPLTGHPTGLDAKELAGFEWALREIGSGTRSAFEAHLPMGMKPSDLKVALTLPSNEALLTVVAQSHFVTAISELAARPLIEAGRLVQLPLDLPERPFYRLRHRERAASRAAQTFVAALIATT
ncbi:MULTISPECIES: LysR family transcriptional regulator [unclassified Brevundimonas]|uniref:LysR family transcriptional regulator n=1 Tax=unclassified Brevundimonas TaxID=2622653 RepID=UPI0025C2077E|nr:MULTISPECIES: LysR substrate-binding domain-containing protein [unclassified Brevundimonas]